MLEALAEARHLTIQFQFAGMAKRGMPKIVSQRQSFGELFVQSESNRERTGHLGNFYGVRKTVAEMIAETGGENLRLPFHAAESAGMDNAITIALKIVAVGVRRLWEFSTTQVI
jgi:hypothetical protein